METANKLTYLSTKFFTENKEEYRITVTVSLDDDCRSNMCDWSVTADVRWKNQRGQYKEYMGGCSATGKAFSSENRLLLEVPEYTTFKDGDVLSSKDGSYIFILNTHGKYLTSFYASLAAGKSLNISDNLAAHENHIECYRLATDSEKQKMIKALKKSKNPKAKEYLKRFFGIEERTKYEFKPFDKVLAKYYEDDNWEASLFIRTITDDQDGEIKYECLNGTVYVYCIPFEGNEYLLGTAENPEK